MSISPEGHISSGVEIKNFSSSDPALVSGNLAIVHDVQPGLNLHLRLKSPMQMPALAALLAQKEIKDSVDNALKDLHYVHFARFLPAYDYSALWVITVFDGAYKMEDGLDAYNDSMRSYVMDFVATMGEIFTAILDFVQDAPRLPVNKYPRDFIDFVIANNRNNVNPWSAYPSLTVIDILTAQAIR